MFLSGRSHRLSSETPDVAQIKSYALSRYNENDFHYQYNFLIFFSFRVQLKRSTAFKKAVITPKKMVCAHEYYAQRTPILAVIDSTPTGRLPAQDLAHRPTLEDLALHECQGPRRWYETDFHQD